MSLDGARHKRKIGGGIGKDGGADEAAGGARSEGERSAQESAWCRHKQTAGGFEV